MVEDHKSLPVEAIQGVEFPPLSVITGTNGAGKSQLLEAINGQRARFAEVDMMTARHGAWFHYVPAQALMLSAEGPATQSPPSPSPIEYLPDRVKHIMRELELTAPHLSTVEERQAETRRRILAPDPGNVVTPLALERLEQRAGRSLFELEVDDIQRHAPILKTRIRDPFATTVRDVVEAWRSKRSSNLFNKFLASEGEPHDAFLTDAEFEAEWGTPPWEVLNNVLTRVGLPHRFPAASLSMNAPPYEVKLVESSGAEVTVADLSSGERVLAALALSIFNTSWAEEATALPLVVLLDEPDASLHPSMSRVMLQILQEEFVERLGIRVIVTTHSATTVALAPEGSLMLMSRGQPRLRSASRDEALAALTVGLPTLSVTIENRRQVFVEAEDDQALYSALFAILRQDLGTERSAEFISVGKKSTGGGCDAVLRIVGELRDRGADTVRGIVDRDARTDAPNGIHYIADRYAIENVVLDPVLLGTFMLREGVVEAAVLGLPPGTRHIDLIEGHMQILVDGVSAGLNLSGDAREQRYRNGATARVPIEFLDEQGHDLEARLYDAWHGLQAYRHKGLMASVVRLAVPDHPGFLPAAVADIFIEVLAD